MSSLEIRPRFRRVVPWEPPRVIDRFRRRLSGGEAPVKGLIVDHHITLKIPYESQHFWSPQLDLEVEEHPEGALVRGLYGPHPSVWLMFVFFYAALGFIATIVAIIGFSQWNLGLSAGILWLLPVMGFIFLMVWLSARAGQKLGHDQMAELQAFLEQALQEREEIV